MTTFPSHGTSSLQSIAVKPGENLLALIYADGARREWSLEDGPGELISPRPRSGGSAAASTVDGVEGGKKETEWIAMDVGVHGDACDDHIESEQEEADVKLSGVMSLFPPGAPEVGFPSVSVNIRGVLAELEETTKIAMEHPRAQERRVNVINPALVKAKAVLTALVPGGAERLVPVKEEAETVERAWGEEDEEEEARRVLGACFSRRGKRPALGMIGAGGRVSLIAPHEEKGKESSETVAGIKILAIIVLVEGILKALGKGEFVGDIVGKITDVWLQREPVELGVFAKFWADTNRKFLSQILPFLPLTLLFQH